MEELAVFNTTASDTSSDTSSGSCANSADGRMPAAAVFSIMFVAIGMTCFIWQMATTGMILYRRRKPLIALVFFQAVLGVLVTFVTLLASLIYVNCTFLLYFSVIGVNIGDISLQIVLLWKAYLSHGRSKIVLFTGAVPILGVAILIWINVTIGKSISELGAGVCVFTYPVYVVIAKTTIDCISNSFLSLCFILIIYKHYRVLGTSVQKTLITEGLIYCLGVCVSNIITGILLAKEVIGGSTPIIYTIDWYLASYLIIKQLKPSSSGNSRDNKARNYKNDNESVGGNNHDSRSLNTSSSTRAITRATKNKEVTLKDCNSSCLIEDKRPQSTFYSSMDGTDVPSFPRSSIISMNGPEKDLSTSYINFNQKYTSSPTAELKGSLDYPYHHQHHRGTRLETDDVDKNTDISKDENDLNDTPTLLLDDPNNYKDSSCLKK